MGATASYLRLSREQLDELRKAGRNVPYAFHELYGLLPQENTADIDKAWDAITRCLGNGRIEEEGNSDDVRMVYGDDILDLPWPYRSFGALLPERVKSLSARAAEITEERIRERYAALKRTFLWFDVSDYEGGHSSEDLEYTLEHFRTLADFYAEAAGASQCIAVVISG